MRITEPMKIKMVKVRAIQPRYYANGRVVSVGDEHEVDYSDASHLVLAGKAEIVPGTERTKSIGLQNEADRLRRSGWGSGWPQTYR